MSKFVHNLLKKPYYVATGRDWFVADQHDYTAPQWTEVRYVIDMVIVLALDKSTNSSNNNYCSCVRLARY